ncbi:MAG TPA: PEP-CTERM sorting domain-containing protein [Candidatus Binatia bacterium]|nr:PEP-CTERM sorting domain-containing protein [Candidatus Binatia bacterium]
MKTWVASVALACLALAAVPAVAGTVYNDGPINGTTDAWTINFGFAVADTFTVSAGTSTITGLSFGAWLVTGDVLLSAQVALTSEAFGGTSYFNQVVSFTQSGCSLNQYGFDVCTETGAFQGPTLPVGTYWLNLQNAVTLGNNPIYWDENSGVGCTSPGCPSEATCNSCIVPGHHPPPQNLPPESFTLYGNSGGTVPEPGSIALFGSGVLGIIGWLRRHPI